MTSSTSENLQTHILVPLVFKIIQATNGKEAVELWEQEKPELILMDMRMPIMDGYEATKIIKQKSLENQHSTAIIALTATAFNEDRNFMLDNDCHDFIRKPFQEDILLEKIAKYLKVEYLYEHEKDVLYSQNSQLN